MDVERVKFDKFDGYLLSDNITNMVMSMEEAHELYEILKVEFEGKIRKKWKLKK